MSYKHITINERCCIVEYLNLGWSLSKIAKELNRNKSSISREIKRNNLNGRYKAHVAQDKYENRRVKCKPHGKIANASLVNYVQEKLNNHWSPEQISGRLKLEFNKQIISFSTIYSWLYKGILEHCSVDLLRRKGKSLKPRETRGKFNIGKTISQRPKDVRKRLDIGHWELDTIVSSRGKSKACLSTFVERKTRLTKIRIMQNRKASTFNEHCIIALGKFGRNNLKSLTVDRGKEFAGYLELENKLDLDVYFADAYSSWQRGTNENTNGLIREFFPKKFDFSTINQNHVDIVEDILNNRPRKCLGYKTPLEAFNEEQSKCCTQLDNSSNIKEYKNGNKEIFREIINVFNPLINKLSKSVNWEDTRQDLLVHLLEIINKLPEENKFEDDRIIFAYISKALKYEYIKLSKKNDKIKNSEVELNLEIEIGYEEFDSEVEVLNLFEVLTEKEEYIMKLIYINYLSISEVADYMGVSRQAINQAKNRAISKLKKVYLT